jgi:hypothetical protein
VVHMHEFTWQRDRPVNYSGETEGSTSSARWSELSGSLAYDSLAAETGAMELRG